MEQPLDWDSFNRNCLYWNFFRLWRYCLLEHKEFLPASSSFLDLEQKLLILPVGGVGGSFTVGELDSELLVGSDSTFDLDAKATSATEFSMLELPSCRVAVSGNIRCLHSAEISATHLSNPRLLTTKDFDPSPLKESICTPQCLTVHGAMKPFHRGWARRW